MRRDELMEPRIPEEGVMRAAPRAARRMMLVAWMLGAAGGFAGMHAQAGADAVIWEANDQSVVLVPQDSDEAPPNDHPATVAARDVETMLASLRFRFTDDEGETAPIPVFNSEQVDILGAALATGLGRAAPTQDVRFSIIGAYRLSPDALVRRNRLTTGRVFFREGHLNIIFGEIQSPYRKKNIYGQLEQDFYPREYGSRTTPAGPEAVLVASSASRLREDAGETRSDWVIYDPHGVASAPGPSPAPGSQADAAAPSPPPGDVAAEAGSDLEQRLRTLKRLRDEDLISEETYQQKVNEILEEL